MNRLLVVLAAAAAVIVAAVFSVARPGTDGGPVAGFGVVKEDKNPWTGLAPNADPDQFQFAVVSDRTGGHRKGIFSRAVHQINLVQPEFVVSVGDLIEGGATAAANRKQWDEFDGYAHQFAMPFFYCAGNHDAAGGPKTDVWKERLGRRVYHFTYKNCLFIVMNSNDPSGVDKDGKPTFAVATIGKDQIEYVGKALADNPGVRWTFAFVHHPVWAQRDFTETGWLEVEKLLAGKKYTVFCGHVHTYRKFVRQGMNYYQLATTGGGSALRGVEYGEFDQFAWVTVKKDVPVIANILLNGVLNDNLSATPSAEGGAAAAKPDATLEPVTGKVILGDTPGNGLAITFTEVAPDEDGLRATGTSRVAADGSFVVYSPRGGPGLKPGKYVVTVNAAAPLIVDGTPKSVSPVPAMYRNFSTTPFRVEVVKDRRNVFEFKIDAE